MCLFCCVFSTTANAQVSTIQSQVDEILAMTRPGYYIRQKVLDLTANLDPCDVVNSCRQVPLPVTLLYFTGERLDHENVLLKWQTGAEVNNDHFELERTLNPSAGFQTIGMIKGKGTTSTNTNYQFIDHNDYNTYTYYRLKQIDMDGSFTNSTIIAIKGGVSILIIKAFPNPGQEKYIRFKVTGLDQTSGAVVLVYDMQGRLIYQNLNITVSPEEELKLNLSNLPAGKYNVQLSVGDRKSVNSFVLN